MGRDVFDKSVSGRVSARASFSNSYSSVPTREGLTNIHNEGNAIKWMRILSRRKSNQFVENDGCKLARVLGLTDLTSLGVGATLGLGVYVLSGSVARENAGPAVAISFLIAAIASALAGICYAEFASRVPRAGSAYIYSYVTMGEFCAFFIGWNLILEYVIGAACVAKGMSGYVDGLLYNMLNFRMNDTLTDIFPIDVSFLSTYPDFFAISVVMLVTVLLAYGVRESSTVNNVFTVVSLMTVSVVICGGLFTVNPNNWAIPKKIALNQTGNDPKRAGEGGFMPFGWTGVMEGAAVCFYGFVGFDVIATTGEEAKNPKRNIPLAIVFSLIIIFLSYFGVSAVLTMMIPYYDQNKDAAVAAAFAVVDMKFLAYIISCGAVSSLTTNLLGTLFPLPRILYAMAEDGLLFKFLSEVNHFTKTPLIATVLSGILSALFAGLFKLDQLMEMTSIGTLLAYTIVTVCVLLLRFKSVKGTVFENQTLTENAGSLAPAEKLKLMFKRMKSKVPSRSTYTSAKIALLSFCVFIVLLSFAYKYADRLLCTNVRTYLYVILAALCIFSFIVLARQPQNDETLSFKVPLVPTLPCISIAMNVYLMVLLNPFTWIRFVIWLTIGFVIYFFYSINNSVQGKEDKSALRQLSESLPMTSGQEM